MDQESIALAELVGRAKLAGVNLSKIDVTALPRDEFDSEHDYNEAIKVVELLNKIMAYQDQGLWVFSGSKRILDRYHIVPNEGDMLLGTALYRPRIDYWSVEHCIISLWSNQQLATTEKIVCSYDWVLKNEFPNLHWIDPNHLQPLVV